MLGCFDKKTKIQMVRLLLFIYIVLYLLTLAILGWKPVLLFAFIMIGSAGLLGVALIAESRKSS
jgi:hypothetical protein